VGTVLNLVEHVLRDRAVSEIAHDIVGLVAVKVPGMWHVSGPWPDEGF